MRAGRTPSSPGPSRTGSPFAELNSTQMARKVLSKKEYAASIQRLYTTERARPKPLPPLVHSRQLSKEEEEASIKRLYDDSRKVIERKQKAIAQQFMQPKPARVLSSEEQMELIRRMYTQSIAMRKANRTSLQKKLMGGPHDGGSRDSSARRLAREEQQALSVRLCDQALALHRQKMVSLARRYGALPAVRKTMSAAEVQASAERLHQTRAGSVGSSPSRQRHDNAEGRLESRPTGRQSSSPPKVPSKDTAAVRLPTV